MAAGKWHLRYDRRREHCYPVAQEEKCKLGLASATSEAQLRTLLPAPGRRAPDLGEATPGSGGDTGRDHVGSSRPHDVCSIDIGGCWEAPFNALDSESMVALLQEHRIAGPGLGSIQTATMAKGLHGVWDAAEAKKVARSGGMAVLVRGPIQVFRGGGISRASPEVVCFTQRFPLNSTSAHETPENRSTMPRQDTKFDDRDARVSDGGWERAMASKR